MPRKKIETPVPSTPAELAERFKDFPAIDVLERRRLDPRDPGTLPILLIDEPEPCCGDIGHAFGSKPGAKKCRFCGLPFRTWYVRWANLAEQERWSVLRSRGYVKVLVKELRDVDDVVGAHDAKPEDVVSRGDRKQEVLVKMPLPYFIEIRRTRQAEQNARMRPRQLKADVVADVEHAFGDHGGQSVQDSLRIEEASRPRTTLGDELGLPSE